MGNRRTSGTTGRLVRTPTVLVVDDDPDLLHVIKGALEDEGLEVTTASDGGQALGMVGKEIPDLLVLDVALPVVGGQQVAARVHDTRGERFPILAMTADGRAAEKARLMGAYAYLRKPFELADLVSAVWRGLGVVPQA
jgi:CheY-like chemotaxis protein